MSVCCMCVRRFCVSHKSDRKYRFAINFCVFDYLLFADLHIFVYGRAECATISLECTKVKLLILNNFYLTVSLYIYNFVVNRLTLNVLYIIGIFHLLAVNYKVVRKTISLMIYTFFQVFVEIIICLAGNPPLN